MDVNFGRADKGIREPWLAEGVQHGRPHGNYRAVVQHGVVSPRDGHGRPNSSRED